MDREARQRALEHIRENIARFGYHLYIVSGKQNPRFAYTIGLSPKLGHELIFAGGVLFMYKEIGTIIRGVVDQSTLRSAAAAEACDVAPFGTFSFRPCDPSWVTLLMLGATDFYQRSDIPALQVVPDDGHNRCA